MSTSSGNRWFVWIPVLMMSSLLYWAVALGLGATSLMAVGSTLHAGVMSDAETAPDPATVEPMPDEGGSAVQEMDSPIVVRLQESDEPEDVNDNAGAADSAAAPDDASVVAPAQGPGGTAW